MSVYEKLATDLRIKSSNPANVVFARDTRPSGPALVAALSDGLTAVGAKFQDFGFFTTPQLHYVVRCINTKDTQVEYGEATEEGYYQKLSDALKVAMKHKKSTGTVVVDCANGVGGPKLRDILRSIPSASQGGVSVTVVNDDVSKPETLNVQVSGSFRLQYSVPAYLRSAEQIMSRLDKAPQSDTSRILGIVSRLSTEMRTA